MKVACGLRFFAAARNSRDSPLSMCTTLSSRHTPSTTAGGLAAQALRRPPYVAAGRVRQQKYDDACILELWCYCCFSFSRSPLSLAPPCACVRVLCAYRHYPRWPPGLRFHLRPYRIPMDTLRVKHSAVLDLVTTLLGEPFFRENKGRCEDG